MSSTPSQQTISDVFVWMEGLIRDKANSRIYVTEQKKKKPSQSSLEPNSLLAISLNWTPVFNHVLDHFLSCLHLPYLQSSIYFYWSDKSHLSPQVISPCYQGLIHDKKKIIALAYEHLDLPHQVHTPKDCFI